jgi:hypothetical protein
MKPFKFFEKKKERVFSQWLDDLDDYHLGGIRPLRDDPYHVSVKEFFKECIDGRNPTLQPTRTSLGSLHMRELYHQEGMIFGRVDCYPYGGNFRICYDVANYTPEPLITAMNVERHSE